MMKANLKSTFSVLIILTSLTCFMINFSSLEIFAQEQEKLQTIKGDIVPVEWDDEDNITAVAISVEVATDDSTEEVYYEEYRVANDEKGKELMELVGKTVEATGTIETDEEENKTIYIRKYKII